MSVYRSYFSKSNTLIKNNETNNGRNPVTEIFYGTPEAVFSRYLFAINLNDLIKKINDENLTINNIKSHTLYITNTIVTRPDLVGGTMQDMVTRRASSFQLELFTIPQDWDEGNGYDFIYDETLTFPVVKSASNWKERKTNILWDVEGAYESGLTGTSGFTGSTIIAIQEFDNGNENIKIDLTDFINEEIFSGNTVYGLGLKLPNDLEELALDDRRSVGFFTRHTNTFFEPYLETIFDDIIIDDRKFFYLDKENDLFLYSKKGNHYDDVIVNSVTIYDYEDNKIGTLTGNSINKIKTGIYKITLTIDSDLYPDAVLFRDVWNITTSAGKTKDIEQEFYLIDSDEYFSFSKKNRINPSNFTFNYVGIKNNEVFIRGDVRNVLLNVKQLYSSDEQPLDLEYRIFVKQGGHVDINVIDFTKVNRTINGYEFDIDTTWLIPNEYFLELKLNYNGVFEVKNPIKFRVQSESRFFGITD